MPKHHKPEYEHPPTRRKSGTSHHVTEREERSAGRNLLMFAGAAIAIVLGGAYMLMRS